MTFGKPGTEGSRVNTVEDVSRFLDAFKQVGHVGLDTARVYTSGTSEELLGEAQWKSRGFELATKVYPSRTVKHTPEILREYLGTSLKALHVDKIDIFYLHAPDRSTPWEVTFQATDELYKEGKFDKLGISNYMSWEVAEIVMLCRANGWIQPTIYQGIYNAVHRAVEPELFPCLRKFGISFYEYNPLGGGFFTGKYTEGVNDLAKEGTRFDGSTGQSLAYRKRYWKEEYFRAVEIVRSAAEKHGLTVSESALRWVNHHSAMKKEHGDAIIIGASTMSHLEQNLADLEKGPLPEDVVVALDQAWEVVKSVVEPYWR